MLGVLFAAFLTISLGEAARIKRQVIPAQGGGYYYNGYYYPPSYYSSSYYYPQTYYSSSYSYHPFYYYPYSSAVFSQQPAARSYYPDNLLALIKQRIAQGRAETRREICFVRGREIENCADGERFANYFNNLSLKKFSFSPGSPEYYAEYDVEEIEREELWTSWLSGQLSAFPRPIFKQNGRFCSSLGGNSNCFNYVFTKGS